MTDDQTGERQGLEPPAPEVARAYLDEIGVLEHRREARIDRWAVGWLNLANAVFIALFLLLSVMGMRGGVSTVTQPLLLVLLVWGQIVQGAATRSGVQWRFARRQWLVITGAVVLGAVILLTMGLAVFAPRTIPAGFAYVPALIVLVGVGSLGVIYLWRARGSRRPRGTTRPPLPLVLRAETAALGVVLGGTSAIIGLPKDALASALFLLVIALLAVWMFVGRTSGVGIAALGETWGPLHFTVYALSSVAVFFLAAVRLQGDFLTPAISGLVGLGIASLFVIVAVLGDRRGR